MQIRPLRQEDDRKSFTCGDPDLDHYFHRYAGQNQFRLHIGTTYVALEEGEILAFATVSASSIIISDLPANQRKRLPKYPLPVLRLARLAVSKSCQGRGIGKLLLKAMFSLAHEMADTLGCVGVVVDAKQSAISFYEQYGFISFDVEKGEVEDRPLPCPMFLALGAIPREDDS